MLLFLLLLLAALFLLLHALLGFPLRLFLGSPLRRLFSFLLGEFLIVHRRGCAHELPRAIGEVVRADAAVWEVLPIHALEDRVHEVGEDRLGKVRRVGVVALVVDRLARLENAAPDRGRVLRGIADEPQVGRLVGGAGLAGDGGVGVPHGTDLVAGGVAGDDALEDVGRSLGHAVLEDLLGIVGVLVDDVAVAVLDARDAARVAVVAAGREDREALGHLEGRNADRADGDREVRGDVDVDAHEPAGLDDLLSADGLGDLRVGGVGREDRRALEGLVAVVGVAVVLDLPRGRDLHRRGAVEVDVGVHARAQGCDERIDLEARAALACRGGGGVELVVVVAAAADHGAHVAVSVLDADEGAGERVVPGLVELVDDGALRRTLDIGVDGGVDLEAALEDGRLIEVLEQELAHVVGEVGEGAHGVAEGADVQDELLGGRRIELLLGDVARIQHAVEDDVAARDREVGVDRGVVDRRRLRQADE